MTSPRYFASLQLRKDEDEVDKLKGKRRVLSKNTPSIVNIFGIVDTAYHKVEGQPEQVHQKEVQPFWRGKAEKEIPIKMHHPAQGDLVFSKQEDPESADRLRELGPIVAKLEKLEDELHYRDFLIEEQEKELHQMRALRQTVKSLKKSQRREVCPFAVLSRQRVHGSTQHFLDHNRLLSDRGLPVSRKVVPLGPTSNTYNNAVMNSKFGKKMFRVPNESPFVVDPLEKMPTRQLPHASTMTSEAFLNRYAKHTKAIFNKGVFTSGSEKTRLKGQQPPKGSESEIAVQTQDNKTDQIQQDTKTDAKEGTAVQECI